VVLKLAVCAFLLQEGLGPLGRHRCSKDWRFSMSSSTIPAATALDVVMWGGGLPLLLLLLLLRWPSLLLPWWLCEWLPLLPPLWWWWWYP